jgi:hypothetical protein
MTSATCHVCALCVRVCVCDDCVMLMCGRANSDVATSHFRDAIRVDARHYNAWYGLGTVYYRQVRMQCAVFVSTGAVTCV